MPERLAQALLELEPRLSPYTHTDSWALSWMLAVGATYSLARAKALLPGTTADFRHDAITVLSAIRHGQPLDTLASKTWSLGFYLNSTEARIQAGVHRVLRAYTGRDGTGPALIAVLAGLPPSQQPPARALDALVLLRNHVITKKEPSSPLARVWVRSNSVKHDPAQDVSDQFNFAARWSDCREAIEALIGLINDLGTHCGVISTAA